MIKLEERFSACIVVNDVLIPNTWELTINLIPNSNTQKNYNIALDRIQFYIGEVLDNSILLSPQSVELFAKSIGINGTVHTLPGEPYDHLLSICLYTKLNSILERVFFVESVGVSSYQGEGITHTYDCESGDMETLRSLVHENAQLLEYANYWYKPDIVYFDLHPEGLRMESKNWDELNLEFDSDDDRVVKLSNFKPRIIPKDDNDDTLED